MKKNIFWHICELNNWKLVVEDQIATIIKSGLLEKIDNIYITFLGNHISNIEYITKISKKIIIYNFHNDVSQYERSCLHSLKEWSLYNNSIVLYIHSKGVTRPNTDTISYNDNVWSWRKMMEFFLIEHHDICINKILEGFDVIGCNLVDHGYDVPSIDNESHRMHFSGNFWWSHTNHIRKLPPIFPNIQNLHDNKLYWACERWILQNYPECKVFEIFKHNKKWFYKYPILKSEYENALPTMS